MKVFFIIQGDGIGHLTQAVTMKQILEKNGHTVTGAVVGGQKNKNLPEFFTNKINAEILNSPTFKTVKGKINISSTIFSNLMKIPDFIASVNKLDIMIKNTNPVIVINFYEPLCGLWNLLKKPSIPTISIGHQYFFDTASFIYPDNNIFQRFLIKAMNKITSFRSDKYALSFYEAYDDKIEVIPPLLRNEVLDSEPSKGDFVLMYLYDKNLVTDAISLAETNTKTKFVAFADIDHPIHNYNIEIYPLSDKLFIKYLKSCRMLMTTSGFESVCEAAYFEKPVLMIPVKNHYEKKCNAFDAQRAGYGVGCNSFMYSPVVGSFTASKGWLGTAEHKFLKLLAKYI